jgi:hypothetical protein
MKTELVYIVVTEVDGVEWKEVSLLTEVRLRPPDPPREDAKWRVEAEEMRSEPTQFFAYTTDDPQEDENGVVTFYDLGFEETAIRKLIPLTRENFVRLKDFMVGWDEISARMKSTEDLQFFFRSALVP